MISPGPTSHLPWEVHSGKVSPCWVWTSRAWRAGQVRPGRLGRFTQKPDTEMRIQAGGFRGWGMDCSRILLCSAPAHSSLCDGCYVFHSVFIHLAQLQHQRLVRYPQLPRSRAHVGASGVCARAVCAIRRERSVRMWA